MLTDSGNRVFCKIPEFFFSPSGVEFFFPSNKLAYLSRHTFEWKNGNNKNETGFIYVYNTFGWTRILQQLLWPQCTGTQEVRPKTTLDPTSTKCLPILDTTTRLQTYKVQRLTSVSEYRTFSLLSPEFEGIFYPSMTCWVRTRKPSSFVTEFTEGQKRREFLNFVIWCHFVSLLFQFIIEYD